PLRHYCDIARLHLHSFPTRRSSDLPSWEGEMLNVTTTNGGVNLVMPDNYSAHIETSTVNGNVNSEFPLNVPMTERGRLPKEISVDLGSGGPTIRATTTNGGVHVSRASVAN